MTCQFQRSTTALSFCLTDLLFHGESEQVLHRECLCCHKISVVRVSKTYRNSKLWWQLGKHHDSTSSFVPAVYYRGMGLELELIWTTSSPQ